MTEKSGFFVSINGDRKYSADDFGRMFDGVISDGIFQNWGRGYRVSKGSGRDIVIESGRAWFKGHWIENDSNKVYVLNEGSTDGDRYDAIFLKVDKSPNVRAGGIRVVQGTVGAAFFSLPRTPIISKRSSPTSGSQGAPRRTIASRSPTAVG